MHRTEGPNYVLESGKRRYQESTPPETVVNKFAMNAIQEELCLAVEDAGLTVAATGAADRTAGWGQLTEAIKKMLNVLVERVFDIGLRIKSDQKLYLRTSDNTEYIWYDSGTAKIQIKTDNSITLDANSGVHLTASGITLNSDDIELNSTGNILHDSYTAVIKASDSLELDTPTIELSSASTEVISATDIEFTTPNILINTKPLLYNIGDWAHGGVVFWIDPTQRHGLVLSNTETSTGVRWYAGTNGNTQAKGNGVYAGKANTSIIIASQVAIGDDNSPYAARICNELALTQDSIDYADWYLPSIDEFVILRYNLATISAIQETLALHSGDGLHASAYYWSSTEHDNDEAKVTDRSTSSTPTEFPKNTAAVRVRAIRSF